MFFIMKKNLLFAALAVVAMASCTKNELKVPSTGTDAVISFQPVVANATKATYLTTDNMKTACASFGVFAWYAEPTLAPAGSATAYMDNVIVTYAPDKDDATDGSGAWKPAENYYWPKNGTLSFDAYAPAAAHAATPGAGTGNVTSTADKGLKIENYTVAALANQYDLLYSTRTKDKKTSTGGNNATYDGVDIAFKHALSAIEVTAKTDKDYSGAIKLTKITIQNAYSKGTFKQNMTDAITEGTAAWYDHGTEESYVLFNHNSGVALNETALTSTVITTPISNAILLPQDFSHTGGNKVSIRVDYTIKHGTEELAQYYIADLSTITGHEGSDPSAPLSAWKIGKRYTYNFIFSLEDIYFAPEVEDWSNVTVDNIDVK